MLWEQEKLPIFWQLAPLPGQPSCRPDMAAFVSSKTNTIQKWSLASVALSDAYTDFMLSRQAKQCSLATLEFYRYMLGPFLAWLEGQGVTSPDEVTARWVRGYLAQLHGADTSIHDHARAIKTLLRFWNVEGYSGPVTFDMPRVAKKRLPVLTAEELCKVLQSCNVRDKAIVLLMVELGPPALRGVRPELGGCRHSERVGPGGEGQGRKSEERRHRGHDAAGAACLPTEFRTRSEFRTRAEFGGGKSSARRTFRLAEIGEWKLPPLPGVWGCAVHRSRPPACLPAPIQADGDTRLASCSAPDVRYLVSAGRHGCAAHSSDAWALEFGHDHALRADGRRRLAGRAQTALPD